MFTFYWVGNNTKGNFGDVLTPKLLDYFQIPYQFERDRKQPYDAICIGSILRHAHAGVHVFGSGFMSRKNVCSPDAVFHSVRGPVTHQLLADRGIECPRVFGDPALLLPMLVEESAKRYDVGIVPHESHYQQVRAQYPNEHVINLRTHDALEVAQAITECRTVISGSLHGVIAAHAYNIPVAWVNFGALKGDGMKFEDHYQSVGLDAVQSTMEEPLFSVGNFDVAPLVDVFHNIK